jgi:hypothetical protein
MRMRQAMLVATVLCCAVGVYPKVPVSSSKPEFIAAIARIICPTEYATLAMNCQKFAHLAGFGSIPTPADLFNAY